MIKSGSRTGGTGPVMKKRGGKVKKLAMAGPTSNKDLKLDPAQVNWSNTLPAGSRLGSSSFDTRSNLQRAADWARNIPVGKNTTLELRGGLRNPSATIVHKFNKGGTVKKSSSTAKKYGGRSCW